MIFDKIYNRPDFVRLLQTRVFPNFVIDTKSLSCSRKTKFVENGIVQIGLMRFSDGIEVPVRELEQQSTNDPRISVTKDAFKLLHDHQKDNALIVFWNKESSSRRLSLLTSTYEWRSKTNSNPKRYSFLLWTWEKTKTPQKYLIDKWPIKNLEDLVARFDVEVVRKEFFKLYINLFLELYSTIKSNDVFQVLIHHKKIEPVSFTKNLMGKMIFLYFIQKKWWLGIADPNKPFGIGDRDFFKNNFDKLAHDADLFQKHSNFYNDFLEPLFYSGLNKKNIDDWHPTLSMKVPYLNGGLFEEEYDWKNTMINLDNEVFKNIINSFNTYNFTIDEDDAHDREIAVDPEMLGKIFESMISVSKDNIDQILDVYNKAKIKSKVSHPSPETILKIDIGKDINKKFGAFYTPREIVNYMTKESLIAHIVTKLHEKNSHATENDLNDLVRKLFDYKEKHLSKSEIDADKTDGYESLKKYVFDIQDSLKTLKILDPAVGSWAFPMGILQEVLGLRRYLIDTFDLKQETDFEIKKQIVQNSIYGVDIDPGAIDIARLRFWLSLIVDASEPVPLPNLDFKFVCANTLIPLEKNDSLFTASDIIMDLKDLRLQYFASTDSDEKEELKKKFKLLQLALSWFGQKARHDMTPKEWKKYIEDQVRQNTDLKNRQVMDRDPFDSAKSNTWFDSNMMFGIDGFDIIIGNPPYIFAGDLPLNIKNRYKEVYTLAVWQFDLFWLFYEFSFKNLYWNWLLTFITPNRYISNSDYKTFRKFLLTKINIKQIIDLWDGVFEGVNMPTAISILQNSISESNEIYFWTSILAPKTIKKQIDFLWNNAYIFSFSSNDKAEALLGKINNSWKKLFNIVRNFRWVEIWKKSDIISREKISDSVPFLRWEDIDKYIIRWNVYIKLNEPWINYKEDFLYHGPVILIRKTWAWINAVLDAEYRYFIQVIYWFLVNDSNYSEEYLLWVINSNLINWRYNSTYGNNNRKVFPHLTQNKILEMPIKDIAYSDQRLFIELVDQILARKKENPKADTSELEKRIDQMVYELYGLTDEEVKVVEESLG
jgi:type I restriction-modification system DNA methylase subunit